ncbi:DUF3500 domain-containing protein [Nocardia sp. NPDC050697]|uniref:DUF3500 domain-containing protein n=1 Tax=Nocardia sp. NPDC050697 TaxID=3155158 RepID=UPI0033E2F704
MRRTGTAGWARVWTAAVAALALLAAGCSDSPDSSSAASSSSSAVAEVTTVVNAAKAFADSLDQTQREQALLELTEADAVAWSNLPCGQSCRGGVPLGDLSEQQQALADTLLKAALGTGDSGWTRVEQLRVADEYLAGLQSSGQGGGPGGGTPPSGSPDQGTPPGGGTPPSGAPDGGMPQGGGLGGYGAGLYDLALLGSPSTDGTWILHFGGHHLAVNFTYRDGAVAGPSPYFVGVEPTSFETGGTAYTPLRDMADAVRAATAGLSADQLARAKLGESFTDVLMGPGKDGQFPETKQGLAVSELNADQKQLVLAAMRPWVGIADDATAAATLAGYEKDLDETYLAYSGGTGLTAQGDYFRLDGPGVWIEFVCQNGVVVQDQIHYHTIWRDHTRDYGGEFTFR